MFVVAVSNESIRRIPTEHGVFAWNIQYRYLADGPIRARGVVAYHMAFDKAIQTMTGGFHTGEIDTSIEELTPELNKRVILEASGSTSASPVVIARRF